MSDDIRGPRAFPDAILPDLTKAFRQNYEQTLPDDFVRSHTFRFITPAITKRHKIPNPCNLCYKDKSTHWAATALAEWRERSPLEHAELRLLDHRRETCGGRFACRWNLCTNWIVAIFAR